MGQPSRPDGRRFVQGVVVGSAFGATTTGTGRASGDFAGRGRCRLHPRKRRQVCVLVGVFVFTLLLRRARERSAAFADDWGGSERKIHIGDRGGTVAYDLSAATQDEIAELRALEKSLGTAAITTDLPSQRLTTTEANDGARTDGAESSGSDGPRGNEVRSDVSVAASGMGRSAVGGVTTAEPSLSSSSPPSSATRDGSAGCDAVLADKIKIIEGQAQRWQAMVLQRAQAHAAFASAAACQSGRHHVDGAGDGGGAGPGSGAGVAAGSTTSVGGGFGGETAAVGTGVFPRRESEPGASTGSLSSLFPGRNKGALAARPVATVVPGDASVQWQREVLGVCVPYRARRDQLEVFASHMRTFLHGQGVPFRIYVGEQMAAGAFNRGWALNVAFTFAESEVDYVVMHDVDMLPLPGVDYRYDPGRELRHLSTEVSQFDYALPYDKYCSGVLLAHKAFFRSVNGFATQFWGWGGEDDEFCARVAKKKHGGWGAAEKAPGGLDRMFGRPEKVGATARDMTDMTQLARGFRTPARFTLETLSSHRLMLFFWLLKTMTLLRGTWTLLVHGGWARRHAA